MTTVKEMDAITAFSKYHGFDRIDKILSYELAYLICSGFVVFFFVGGGGGKCPDVGGELSGANCPRGELSGYPHLTCPAFRTQPCLP